MNTRNLPRFVVTVRDSFTNETRPVAGEWARVANRADAARILRHYRQHGFKTRTVRRGAEWFAQSPAGYSVTIRARELSDREIITVRLT
jgi:hypothetical protein